MTRPRSIVARVSCPGFSREEAFASHADAEQWKQMVSETLNHPEKIDFDLQTYAAGLADSVRVYGGAVTLDAWLNLQVSPDAWAAGRPVKVDVEMLMRALLSGKRKE